MAHQNNDDKDELKVQTEHEQTDVKDVIADDEPAQDLAPEPHSVVGAQQSAGSTAPIKKSFWHFFKTKNGIITLVGAGVAVAAIAVLLAVPTTRYGILGSFIQKDIAIVVTDSKTGKPVSDVEVSLPGVTAHTDSNGIATLKKVAVGDYTASIKKKYFKDTTKSLVVPVLANTATKHVPLEATGRQVPITAINKVTGAALEKVTINAADATAITDAKGEATLVMPANETAVKATLKATGYNDQAVDVTVTEQKDAKNTFGMTQSGKIYFLSKRTGKINVMKSDLDGANPQIVVQGTGKEEEGGTVLLATRDWKYLLLQSRRDSDKPKLYVIDTSTGAMTVVDEGNAQFTLVGWHDHHFVYSVLRSTLRDWQPKRQALKSFDADSKKLATLDETAAEGTSTLDAKFEFIKSAHIIDTQNIIVYAKSWGYTPADATKLSTINSVQPDGSNKKKLKTFEPNSDIYEGVLYDSDEIYYRVFQSDKMHFYEYADGSVKENTAIKEDTFTQFYATYLLSPSGQKTAWYEPRDGKNTLLIGDKTGKDGKEIATLSDYTPYGWYTDDYLLVSKKGSELYIVPAATPDITKALKITDYHKPNTVFRGYGGGYGGGF